MSSRSLVTRRGQLSVPLKKEVRIPGDLSSGLLAVDKVLSVVVSVGLGSSFFHASVASLYKALKKKVKDTSRILKSPVSVTVFKSSYIFSLPIALKFNFTLYRKS